MKLHELMGYVRNKKKRVDVGQDDPKRRWLEVMAKPQINVSSPHHVSNLVAPNPMKPTERYVR